MGIYYRSGHISRLEREVQPHTAHSISVPQRGNDHYESNGDYILQGLVPSRGL